MMTKWLVAYTVFDKFAMRDLKFAAVNAKTAAEAWDAAHWNVQECWVYSFEAIKFDIECLEQSKGLDTYQTSQGHMAFVREDGSEQEAD